jgi:hypothetical protein
LPVLYWELAFTVHRIYPLYKIMPNLINTDNAGNVFYNYVTPTIQGEVHTPTTFADGMTSLLSQKLLSNKWIFTGQDFYFTLPAPGLENRTGTVSSSDYRFRWYGNLPGTYVNSSNAISGINQVGTAILIGVSTANKKIFCTLNDYAFTFAVFDTALNNLERFHYLGWLREPVYSGNQSPAGLTIIRRSNWPLYIRPASANLTSSSSLSTEANSITSPPIVCTPGTDPGDGSETWTDIVIRDAAAPNNPVGKLWNCVDAPANYTVGRFYKNVGAYDADGSTSEQDIYLCVMPWGERKLLMRVWAENVFS